MSTRIPVIFFFFSRSFSFPLWQRRLNVLDRLSVRAAGNILQISVLNLFVQFKARFPNMVVGEITRRKMRGALEKGISADQVS